MRLGAVCIGYDSGQPEAWRVAERSLRFHSGGALPVIPIKLDVAREAGLYWRPTEQRGAQLWDIISDAPMGTEFAITRFLTPHVYGDGGWVVFCDCDMLFREDVQRLAHLLDERYAVMCVKHDFASPNATKMAGKQQLPYARKNWSSFVAFNSAHPANAALTVDLINTVPGRDLHRFCWLRDDEIGELAVEWNWLVGHSSPEVDPNVVHYTEGTPLIPGHENDPYAAEWRGYL